MAASSRFATVSEDDFVLKSRLIHLSCNAILTFDASLAGYGAQVSCCNEIEFCSGV